jgi:multisubunit Na+/H+ antiporter MnhE subunit
MRLKLHSILGGAFCGLWLGWILQSIAGAIFGFIFGAVSVGGTAAMLAARRYVARPD